MLFLKKMVLRLMMMSTFSFFQTGQLWWFYLDKRIGPLQWDYKGNWICWSSLVVFDFLLFSQVLFDSSSTLSSSQIATALLEHLQAASLEHSQDQANYADMEEDDFPVQIVTQTQNTAFWTGDMFSKLVKDSKQSKKWLKASLPKNA